MWRFQVESFFNDQNFPSINFTLYEPAAWHPLALDGESSWATPAGHRVHDNRPRVQYELRIPLLFFLVLQISFNSMSIIH